MKSTLLSFVLIFFYTQFLPAQEELFTANTLDLRVIRDANAVVRQDKVIVDLKSQDKMEVFHYRVITVLNAKGNKAVGASLYYDDEKKITNLEAEVFDASGNRIHKYREYDFKDESYSDGFSLYNDARMKIFPYRPLSYPYTVAFTSEIKTSNTAFIPNYFFIKNTNVKVQDASFKIKYDEDDHKLTFNKNNLENYSISQLETEEGISFKGEDLPVLVGESMSPHHSIILPHISCISENFHLSGYDASGIKSWNDLGEWYSKNLLPGRDELPLATVNEVKELTKNISDTLEKAKKIYEYVQENMRYISVQVGIGGLQPIAADEVDEKKYGDCKGLANYTYALLKSIGIQSNLVIIEAGNEKVDFEENFPNFWQGNHMILAIPEGDNYSWIDCTSKDKPFGFLGNFTDDRKAFVIKPNGGEIVNTPAFLNKDNYQKTIASVHFNEEGSFHADGTIITKGSQYDNRSYIENLSPKDLVSRDQSFWDEIKNIQIKKHEFLNKKDSLIFTEKFEIVGDNFTKLSSNRIIFPLNVLNRIDFIPKRYRNRTLPFVIYRGYFDEDEIEIYIPENYKIEALPESKSFQTEFGTYKQEVLLKENTIVLKKSLLIRAGQYPKDKYSAYRDFRKKIANAESVNASIIKK
ncbi:DUF3857 domain-containing transglutaminase family protein [Mesonia aquimarina]|uniref:DUF3857 domain-containing transglutaminase family protein n=1 Tax=Mesonia aquimarina TaxID=1504967 RepID=UPI000EF5827A|nr:DUF3857 and transglutaminase domain-containing protein [Mesonia aquimarina]